MRYMRNAYKILVGIREGERSLGKHRRRWEDNIRMDLTETDWRVVDWIHVIQDRPSVVGSCEHGNKPLGS
jgi:hypothetical protein